MKKVGLSIISVLLIVCVLAACGGGAGAQTSGGVQSNPGTSNGDTASVPGTQDQQTAGQDALPSQGANTQTSTPQADPDIEVVSVTPLTPAEPMHLETDRATVTVTSVERRVVRRISDSTEKTVITVYFDVTNHTDRELQRFEATDPLIWVGAMSLQDALSMTEIGLVESDPNWYKIGAGETKSMVLSRAYGEFNSLDETPTLMLVVYGESADTKQVTEKIPLA